MQLLLTSIDNTIVIFKKFRKSDRFLTFREIFEEKLDYLLDKDEYYKRGIEIVTNSSEEICAATLEMHERLTSTWNETKESIELQNKFFSIFIFGDLHKKGLNVSRIGTDFLTSNKDLLE